MHDDSSLSTEIMKSSSIKEVFIEITIYIYIQIQVVKRSDTEKYSTIVY